MNSLPVEFTDLIKLAKQQGWSVDRTGGNHLKWRNPKTGKFVISSATPSDHRACLNLRAELKRHGLTTAESVESTVAAVEPVLTTTEYFTMPEKAKRREKLPVQKITIELLSTLPPVTLDEFWPQASAKLPGVTRDYYVKALSRFTLNGTIAKSKEGKYSLSNRSLGISPVRATKATPIPDSEDMAILNSAVDLIAKLERLIQKYQGVVMDHDAALSKARAELMEKLK